ncbi:MAG: carbohydrate ABC transporter permease [Peptostreptococcaceae bacterium]|nr:carbohydrate ABC transporter permease [Peptostreptococcaceae bacterium]
MIKKNRFSLFSIVNNFFLVIYAILVIYPIYYTFLISISDYSIASEVVFFTTKIDLSAYKAVFGDSRFVRSFINSMIVTTVGLILNLLITSCSAYSLSVKGWKGKNIVYLFVLIPLFFSGGLIPYYLNIRDLHLINSLWVMILPTMLNLFFLFILINFFKALPASLAESANLDGANDIVILFRIILPISKPALVAIGLFYAVERWNEWWHALLFINDSAKYPLQLMLREMIMNISMYLNNQASSALAQSLNKVYAPSLKMATVMVATVPIMLVFPFLQKHFAKGIMIGSIKG